MFIVIKNVEKRFSLILVIYALIIFVIKTQSFSHFGVRPILHFRVRPIHSMVISNKGVVPVKEKIWYIPARLILSQRSDYCKCIYMCSVHIHMHHMLYSPEFSVKKGSGIYTHIHLCVNGVCMYLYASKYIHTLCR